MTLDAYLAQRADRCAYGYAQQQHPALCECSDSEWHVFVRAVRASVRSDGSVHQGDMRPHLRGKVQPRHIGTLYRRAKSEGLLADTGEREPSNDFAGRNGDKLDRVYRLVAA